MSSIVIGGDHRYRSYFLYALIGVSLLPATVSVINFEILDGRLYATTLMFSFVALVAGSHAWMTIAYYFDKNWLGFFKERPHIFFSVPLLLIAVCMLFIVRPNSNVAIAIWYSISFINLWHHGKQNWGVLNLVAKNRGVSVGPMHKPLVYAWPFFVIPFCLLLPPEVKNYIGVDLLTKAAWISAVCYLGFAAAYLVQVVQMPKKDPVVLAFCFVLAIYFVPMLAFVNKPYGGVFFAAAHGIQYYLLVLMSLSLSNWKQSRPAAIVKSVLLTLIWLVALFAVRNYAMTAYGVPSLWDNVGIRLVTGFATGITLVHYWVDGFIWRLSDERVRKLHGDAFAF